MSGANVDNMEHFPSTRANAWQAVSPRPSTVKIPCKSKCRSGRIWGIFLFLALSIGEIRAQLPDYHLQLFDYTSGIRPGMIMATARDARGFLWILYPRSIQRFDGNKAVVFKSGGNFQHLFSDADGRIWLSTAKEIFRFEEHQGEFREISLAPRDSQLVIGHLFQMPGKPVAVITTAGFYEFRPRERHFAPILTDLPLKYPIGVRIFGAYGSTLFFRKGNQLFRYQTQEKKLDSLPDQNIQILFPLNEDSLLATTWQNNSFWYNFRSGVLTTANPPESVKSPYSSTFSVRSMVEFEPNRFLLATRDGILEYNSRQQVFKRLKFFLNGRQVATNDYSNSIHLDKEGVVWLGAIDGIARFSIRKPPIGLIRIRQLNDDLPAGIDNIRKIVEDEQGNLWLATGSGFVCWKKDRDDWILFLPAPGATDRLNHPSIRGLTYDGKYLILGPADLGLWLFDPKTYRYRRPAYDSQGTKNLSVQDFIDDILTLRSGDHLVMGRDALYRLDGKTYQLSQVVTPASGENLNYAFQGRNGVVWLTTAYGLHCLDESLNYRLKVPLPPEANPVTAGCVLPDDRLLFSCAKGVFTARYYETGGRPAVALEKFTGVFDGIFLATLYQDRKGSIWATSDNGIYRYDPATSKMDRFDYSDNVQGYGFNGNSWLRSKEGFLFFGGINGLNYLQPESMDLQNESLQVFIHRVRNGTVDSVVYHPGQKAVLRYAQRSLEAEFVAPYFNNAEKVKFRYRLEGFDSDWKYTGNNNLVRFNSLAPGDYTLRLEATLNNVDWVAAKNHFSFSVQAPFWLTWWFILFSGLLLAGGLTFFIRNRNKKIAEKMEDLEAEQAIHYFSSSMSEEGSEEQILWGVVKNCIGRLNFEHCVIYLVDENRNVLVQKAALGPKSNGQAGIFQPLEIPLGKGIAGSAAAAGRAELVKDTTRDARYIVDDKPRMSEIAVPIVSDGKVLGVIDCEHSKKAFFTQKHLSILTTIASLCAGKMVKARAEAEKQAAELILMDTREKMADAEMQALRAQMNPHFIFNCLNSINRYIVKSDQATASLYLTRFAKLIRLILDNSNSKTVTLANELEALRLYIEMESIRFERQFSYSIEVEEGVQADNICVPPLIIQPYVENAIWHGLLHKENEGRLTIRMYLETGSQLICVIEDDGIGREKARELRSKNVSTKKSLGMKLTEDRLALLNKQAQLDASVEVEDLKTEDGTPAGTRVILKIPVDD